MWASNTPCSHFAFMLDTKIVFQSTFSKGVHLSWLQNFLSINTVVHRIDLSLPLETEEKIYLCMIGREGKPYDFVSLIYLSYRFLKHKLFNTPLPSRNKLANSHADVCVELASCLEIIGVAMPSLDTVTPESLYLYLKDKLNDFSKP